MGKHEDTTKWKYEISPKGNLFTFNFKEIWNYRDLIFLFVKRDVVTLYKQTILGPLWYLVQPIFTAVVFTIIFNNVADIDTDGIPPFLYNLAGITVWNYFRDCLMATSDTFKNNQHIFGKVYFPRLVIPISVIISTFIKFVIQLLVFAAFYIYYNQNGVNVTLHEHFYLFTAIVVLLSILSLGLGMLISSLVTKYRDLVFLLQFGVQLLMYLSLVAYPLSLIKEKLPQLSWIVEYNPMAHLVEATRYFLLNTGSFSINWMIYTTSFTIITFLLGLLVFNHTERKFIDTV